MPDETPIRTVMFLCTGNYYRSRFAEILFNHLASQQKLEWTADSRGLDVKVISSNVGPLSAHTRRGCQARNLPLSDDLRFPQPLAEDDLRRSHLVVALKEAEHRSYLERLFPEWQAQVKYWHVHDLDAALPDVALGEIESNVRSLIAELKRHAPSQETLPKFDHPGGHG